MNIICLYWVGEFRGRDFTEEDVWRLWRNVDQWMDRAYTFYTLTNDMQADLPGEKIELNHNWPGWWSKMELHRPDLPEGRTLYLDLDSYVVSSLGCVLDCEGDLVMFPSRSVGGSLWEGKRQIHKYQAATMLFTPGKLSWFYSAFCKNPKAYMDTYRSEQDMMGAMLPCLSTFPAQWLQKMSELKVGTLKPETVIVTGQPKGISFRELIKNKC